MLKVPGPPWTQYLVAAISRSGTRTLLARGPATSQPGGGDQERLVEASTCSRASVVIMYYFRSVSTSA